MCREFRNNAAVDTFATGVRPAYDTLNIKSVLCAAHAATAYRMAAGANTVFKVPRLKLVRRNCGAH